MPKQEMQKLTGGLQLPGGIETAVLIPGGVDVARVVPALRPRCPNSTR